MRRKRRPRGLTPEGVRDLLDEARLDLQRLDAERDAYLKLIAGYEGWLRLHGEAATPAAGEGERAGE